MPEFTLLVTDMDILPEVSNSMKDSGIKYEVLENEWCGPYGDKYSRARCLVRTETDEEARILRKAIGVQYGGMKDLYYAVGKKKRVHNRIDHGLTYSKTPGPARTRARTFRNRYF